MRQGKNVAEDRRLDRRSWGTTSSAAASAAQSGRLRAPARYALYDAALRHTGTRCDAPYGRLACRQVQGVIPTTSLQMHRLRHRRPIAWNGRSGFPGEGICLRSTGLAACTDESASNSTRILVTNPMGPSFPSRLISSMKCRYPNKGRKPRLAQHSVTERQTNLEGLLKCQHSQPRERE